MTGTSAYILGLDLGTSGFRAQLVCEGQSVFAAHQARIDTYAKQHNFLPSEQSTQDWLLMLDGLFAQLKDFLPQVKAVIADATSSTVIGLDKDKQVIEPAIMYNDNRAQAEAKSYRNLLAADSPAQGAQASLAKALWLFKHTATKHIWHQLDWLYAQFLDPPLQFAYSDVNTQLKMGVDPVKLSWPDSVQALAKWPLPRIRLTGSPIGTVGQQARQRWGLPVSCQVYAGTTDSIASFLATPAARPGDLVITMGSTLAFKLLSSKPLASAKHGLYSHRLGQAWLVGGASNAGGAIYQTRFNTERLSQLSQQLVGRAQPELARYPLTQTGERFPLADPQHPASHFDDLTDEQAFISMTEGLVALEQAAYDQLTRMGAKIERIFSIGGGVRNQAWQARRRQLFGDRLAPLPDPDASTNSAAFGVTRLITESF
ncbi:carbohydrate kinase [Thiomicrospira aerophila AL3]|uniref:Carbohydrate kinase n=1 Tax=Thiomicrospira aerophila AL3 TaxID=717772 RepID=W0DVJ4_9GAMM|nr:FGGY-family carbohydrate kinase [Thiomicrospira aerophila]AHF01293.1 carbohydrate kinase [Thiomicrospira aerophila AL3]